MEKNEKNDVEQLHHLVELMYVMREGTNFENNKLKVNSCEALKRDCDKARLHILGLTIPMKLESVELRQSKIHGRGVFAIKKMAKDQLVTLYPADVITYRPEGHDNIGKLSPTVDCFGDGMSESSKNNYAKDRNYYNDYSISIIPFYSIIGTPENDKNPTYLGHFINDSARCNNNERSVPIYVAVSLAKANCRFVSISDLLIAIVANRDIEVDEELYAPYGIPYWTRRS